jgi:hypothetical protein
MAVLAVAQAGMNQEGVAVKWSAHDEMILTDQSRQTPPSPEPQQILAGSVCTGLTMSQPAGVVVTWAAGRAVPAHWAFGNGLLTRATAKDQLLQSQLQASLTEP